MGTPCTIAMEYEDGSVKAIYCHYGAYLDDVGETLATDYKDPDKINDLMTLSSVSGVDRQITQCKQMHDDPTPEYDSLQDYIKNHRKEPVDYIYTKGKWIINQDDKDGYLEVLPLLKGEKIKFKIENKPLEVAVKCTIAFEWGDYGSVSVLTCKKDGELENTGYMLQEYYPEGGHFEYLLSKGNLIRLGSEPELSEYGSYRSEPRDFSTLDEYEKFALNQGLRYINRKGIWYLFKDNTYQSLKTLIGDET